jgi:hypothetical protein
VRRRVASLLDEADPRFAGPQIALVGGLPVIWRVDLTQVVKRLLRDVDQRRRLLFGLVGGLRDGALDSVQLLLDIAADPVRLALKLLRRGG